jgi:threonine dehydratase
MIESYIKRILSARVYDVAIESPLDAAPGLSRRLGHEVFLKREDLQPIFSFKCRGAYNRIVNLTEAQQRRGVIAASAGNHAQGVALAARRLGLRAVIVMGRNTPGIKVSAVRALGAEVELHGDTFDDAAARARELAEADGLTFVPPYDDPDVIAGQGTVGVEVLRQCRPAPDCVYVPVGGGGLLAGMALYIKYLSPGTRMIGVESEGSACLKAALQAGERVVLPRETLDLFADGVSVAQIGEENFRVLRDHVDEVVTVDTDAMCAAIKDVFEETRVLMEPAGALAVAGMKAHAEAGALGDAPQRLVAVTSGANVNFDRLRHISERADVGEHREALLAVRIPERPGSFKALCRAIGKRLVTEFNYRYAGPPDAQVFIGLQTAGQEDLHAQVRSLRDAGYDVEDLTSNELAKVHLPHLVGGRAPAGGEQVYRFEFPERPGALMQFLDVLADRWNISLFHYRNHGAAYGRVLMAFQAQARECAELEGTLDATGYRWFRETDNPAYRRFLGASGGADAPSAASV